MFFVIHLAPCSPKCLQSLVAWTMWQTLEVLASAFLHTSMQIPSPSSEKHLNNISSGFSCLSYPCLLLFTKTSLFCMICFFPGRVPPPPLTSIQIPLFLRIPLVITHGNKNVISLLLISGSTLKKHELYRFILDGVWALSVHGAVSLLPMHNPVLAIGMFRYSLTDLS